MKLETPYLVEALNTGSPVVYSRDCPHMASAGAVLAHYAEDHDTVLIWRKDPGAARVLVCRYDRDGFDL